MINQKWKDIWNKREINSNGLQSLISASGFDTKYGAISEDEWRRYVETVATKLDIKSEDNILEIGCGCGAFLSALQRYSKNLNGIDYSEPFLLEAQKLNPKGVFEVLAAHEIEKLEMNFSVIVSNSVFQYFDNIKYADTVLAGICKKLSPKGSVAILDVNDMEKREFYEEERAKELGGIEKYKEKYRDTPHMFYHKNYFIEYANANGFFITIEDQNIKEYINSRFRFNVYMFKK